jgi:hypothetical protein
MWWIAMLAVLPLIHGERMFRTWLAVTGAAVLGWLFPYVAAYVLIDLAAAAVVVRRPRGLPQKGICALFAVMMLIEIGYLFSSQLNGDILANIGVVIGWIMWLLLLSWGLHEYDERNRVDSSRSWTFGPALARERNDER